MAPGRLGRAGSRSAEYFIRNADASERRNFLKLASRLWSAGHRRRRARLCPVSMWVSQRQSASAKVGWPNVISVSCFRSPSLRLFRTVGRSVFKDSHVEEAAVEQTLPRPPGCLPYRFFWAIQPCVQDFLRRLRPYVHGSTAVPFDDLGETLDYLGCVFRQ